jgi:malonyl CoA-acyl carrier protein transacylase
MRDAKSSRVHEIRLAQPISVALQLCLVDLLKSWDITPSAVTSHSSGEIAAAYTVGALSFKEALGVVYYRGELAQKYHERLALAGGMLAAGLSADKAEQYLKDTSGGVVVVACHNSPSSVTLSGDMAALDEVASRLEKDGVFNRKLNVPLAYHSHHMTHMAQDYTDKLNAILPTTPSWNGALFASPVSGDIVTSPKVLNANHYVRNLTSPVLFSEGFENMCFSATQSNGSSRLAGQDVNVDLIVEIGAHSTLAGPIRQILKERKIPYVSCLTRNEDAVQTMQNIACELLAKGYPVSLAQVNFHENGKFVPGLPSYSWNHSSAYWTEPRAFKEYRYKQFQPHELLGTPFSGGNRLTPTWRNFLRTSNIPWLADHKLGSDSVLPGAGYVAMAIEAVRLLTDSTEKTIQGYKLRVIDISNALTIPETSPGVEVQLCLRPCSEKELDYKGWYEFEVCSVSGAEDSWIQHCKGFVTTETISSTEPAATKSERKVPNSESFFNPGAKVVSVDPESIFSGLRKMNLFHGPVFQNLISSKAAANKSITTLSVSPVASDSDCDDTYVLHPTTLDSLIQAVYVSIPETTRANAMVIPRSIRNLFVPRDLNRQSGEKLSVFVDLLKANRRGATLTAIAVNGNDGKQSPSLFQMDGLYCQAVPLDLDMSAGDALSSLCSESRWELDVLYDFPASLKNSMKVNLDDTQVDIEKQFKRASFNFIYDAVAELERAKNKDSWQPYHKLFYEWMKAVVERGLAGKLGAGSQNWSKTNKGLKQKLADELEAEGAAGKLTSRVGRKLASIVRGEVVPLALMMEDNLLNQYYEDIPRLKQRSYSHLRKVIELYAVKNPGASVLEIGGRTGAATTIILEGFAARAEGGSGSLLGHYDFTDESSEYLDAARPKFENWGGLDFKKLNIASNPVDQSFTAGRYDLIIASDVLHLTPDLNETLTNVRKLLKPGGKLLMVETTQNPLDTQLLFGTLPRWWTSKEPARKTNPSVSVETWNQILKGAGFTGVEFEIGDCEEMQYQSYTTIITTALQSETSYPSLISIIYSEDSSAAQTWSKELTRAIQIQTGASVTVENMKDVVVRPDTVYIFTPDLTTPFLETMDSPSFEKLRDLLVNSQGILWLSSGGIIDAKAPLYAQSQGLLRTMKQEDSNKRYILLDFESAHGDNLWSKEKIPHIVHVLKESFNANIEPSRIEWEYAVKDSIVHVPRIYPSPAQDKASSENAVDATPELQSFWQPKRPLVWEPDKTGVLSNLYFTDNLEFANTGVPSGMVEIQTQAFGLNFRDVMVALRQLDEELSVHECSGFITRLGPGTEKSGLKVGDRVCGIMKGRFGNTARAWWTSVTKIADDMSWEDAASLPLIFLTSYIGLFDIGRLEASERVLIHGKITNPSHLWRNP